jgi:hypothetical protein
MAAVSRPVTGNHDTSQVMGILTLIGEVGGGYDSRVATDAGR